MFSRLFFVSFTANSTFLQFEHAQSRLHFLLEAQQLQQFCSHEDLEQQHLLVVSVSSFQSEQVYSLRLLRVETLMRYGPICDIQLRSERIQVIFPLARTVVSQFLPSQIQVSCFPWQQCLRQIVIFGTCSFSSNLGLLGVKKPSSLFTLRGGKLVTMVDSSFMAQQSLSISLWGWLCCECSSSCSGGWECGDWCLMLCVFDYSKRDGIETLQMIIWLDNSHHIKSQNTIKVLIKLDSHSITRQKQYFHLTTTHRTITSNNTTQHNTTHHNTSYCNQQHITTLEHIISTTYHHNLPSLHFTSHHSANTIIIQRKPIVNEHQFTIQIFKINILYYHTFVNNLNGLYLLSLPWKV